MDVLGFAFITGAGSGIGRACARTFIRDGAAGVALADLNEQALKTVKEEIEAEHAQRGGKPVAVHVYPLDVTDEAQVNTIVSAAAQKLGRLDYVVNAAGIAFKHKGGAAFAETKDWQRVIDVNLNGTFFVLRAAAKIMLEQDPITSSTDSRPLQRGSIVNFSSILGLVGIPMSTSYTAAKHAVIGLTKSASEDYAKMGLRINAICPGYINTPMTTSDPAVFAVMEDKVAKEVPMGRMGLPQEIADAVVWLSSGRASFVTGIALSVDGGYVQR